MYGGDDDDDDDESQFGKETPKQTIKRLRMERDDQQALVQEVARKAMKVVGELEEAKLRMEEIEAEKKDAEDEADEFKKELQDAEYTLKETKENLERLQQMELSSATPTSELGYTVEPVPEAGSQETGSQETSSEYLRRLDEEAMLMDREKGHLAEIERLKAEKRETEEEMEKERSARRDAEKQMKNEAELKSKAEKKVTKEEEAHQNSRAEIERIRLEKEEQERQRLASEQREIDKVRELADKATELKKLQLQVLNSGEFQVNNDGNVCLTGVNDATINIKRINEMGGGGKRRTYKRSSVTKKKNRRKTKRKTKRKTRRKTKRKTKRKRNKI